MKVGPMGNVGPGIQIKECRGSREESEVSSRENERVILERNRLHHQ